VGLVDVYVRTNSEAFASLATAVFRDLLRSSASSPATRAVVFETIEHRLPELHWSIHRDGEPCEVQLRDDAVMVHQQWELNRLVIEGEHAVIHAAAVVTRDGGAVLLPGQSHSGKTTLAAWLAAHHSFGYLTDEASAIDDRGLVRPYPRPLGLRADSPMTPALRAAATLRFLPDEVLVPASDLGATVEVAPTPVRLIVFPTYLDDRPLRSARVNQADTIERLARLTPGLLRDGSGVFERLVQLVRSTPAIEVSYPHVAVAADVVNAVLANLDNAR
jgi:hypothetical protein